MYNAECCGSTAIYFMPCQHLLTPISHYRNGHGENEKEVLSHLFSFTLSLALFLFIILQTPVPG